MVPRPTSPTSLLWAHQVRREHNYVNERLKLLEAQHKKLEEMTATISNQLHTQYDTQTKLNEVSARISAIETDDEDLRIWIDALSKERKQSIQEHDSRIDNLARSVGLIEEKNKKFDDHAIGSAERSNEILARLERLEHNSVSAINMATEASSRDIEALKNRIDDLDARRADECDRSQMLLRKIDTLQTSNWEWEKKYRQLQDMMVAKESSPLTQIEHAAPSPRPAVRSPSTLNKVPHIVIPRSPEPQDERRVLRKAPKDMSQQSQAERPFPLRRSARHLAQVPLSPAVPASSPLAARPPLRPTNIPSDRRDMIEPANSHKKRKSVVAKYVDQARHSAASPPISENRRISQRMNLAYPHLERTTATAADTSSSVSRPPRLKNKNRVIIQDYELPPLSDTE